MRTRLLTALATVGIVASAVAHDDAAPSGQAEKLASVSESMRFREQPVSDQARLWHSIGSKARSFTEASAPRASSTSLVRL